LLYSEILRLEKAFFKRSFFERQYLRKLKYNPKNEKTVLEKRKRKVRPGRRKNENGKFSDTHTKKDSV